MLLLQLFSSFFLVGLFCVGGGYASMPLIQAQVIDVHNWLSMSEFIDIFAISQMTPGPIGINAATFVGTKVAGLPGAIAATTGFVAPSLIIVLILAWLFFKYGNMGGIKGILNGLRPAVVALISSATVMFLTLSMWDTENYTADVLNVNFAGLIIIIVALVLIRTKTLGIIQTLIASGLLSLLLHAF